MTEGALQAATRPNLSFFLEFLVMNVSPTVWRPRRLVLATTLAALAASLASGCGDDGGGSSDGGPSTTSPTTSTTTATTAPGTATTAPNTSSGTTTGGAGPTTGGAGPTTTGGATTDGAGGGGGAPGTTSSGGDGGAAGDGPGGDCGAAGESCCQGRVCDAGVCVGNFMNQTCETDCGAPDQPCCTGGMGGGTCQSGLDCNDDDTCEGEPCGAVGLACCTGQGPDCFGGADCVDDVCEAAEEQDDCGGNGEPCCEDDMCFGQNECNAEGICENN